MSTSAVERAESALRAGRAFATLFGKEWPHPIRVELAARMNAFGKLLAQTSEAGKRPASLAFTELDRAIANARVQPSAFLSDFWDEFRKSMEAWDSELAERGFTPPGADPAAWERLARVVEILPGECTWAEIGDVALCYADVMREREKVAAVARERAKIQGGEELLGPHGVAEWGKIFRVCRNIATARLKSLEAQHKAKKLNRKNWQVSRAALNAHEAERESNLSAGRGQNQVHRKRPAA